MNSARQILLDQLPRIQSLAGEYFRMKGHSRVIRGSFYDGPKVEFVRDPDSGLGMLYLVININEEAVDEIDLDIWLDLSTECRMLIDATFPGFDLIKIGNR